MEGKDFKTFALLVAFVLTALVCCLGCVSLNKACEARGGHFEGYWGGKGMTCVGEDR